MTVPGADSAWVPAGQSAPAAPEQAAVRSGADAQQAASPRTGHPAVDDMLAELDAAAALAPADQIATFDSGYRRLQAALSTIDEG